MRLFRFTNVEIKNKISSDWCTCVVCDKIIVVNNKDAPAKGFLKILV